MREDKAIEPILVIHLDNTDLEDPLAASSGSRAVVPLARLHVHQRNVRLRSGMSKKSHIKIIIHNMIQDLRMREKKQST